ncbi:hypothetical protein ACFFQW_37845 [Umezawaea endophytica]|uniref:Uncharacterized protein n=1 Tax=Umezawaea endophytica TaxID=1654476 RepID=A0A9X2VUU9_9PSEU|nr:hypothetical protein [Umezawaea endophytica]MCS7483258.1 hypothetical protein [Umezawaea endophytica]
MHNPNRKFLKLGPLGPVVRHGVAICALVAGLAVVSAGQANAAEEVSTPTSPTVTVTDDSPVKVLGPKRYWDVETSSWRWG